EALPFHPALADGQLDAILDGPLQEPRAVGKAVAVLHELLERFRRHDQRSAAPDERFLDLEDLLLRDLADLVVRQRREHDDLVDAVAELRREAPLHLAHDLALDLLDADVPRVEAERARQLAEV